MIRDAELSGCGKYRYNLTRVWGEDNSRCCWIMLNPSTADAMKDDPTIRRCLDFSIRWGYASMEVVNLFAMRATHPRDLFDVTSPTGGEPNDVAIRRAVKRSDIVVCAWGAQADRVQAGRARSVVAMLRALQVKPMHLGLTKGGQPKHPLYLPTSTMPTVWR